MFNAQSLKKVSQLLRVFSAKDTRFRISVRSWEDFKKLPVLTRKDLQSFVQAGLIREPFDITATSGSTSSRLVIAHSQKAYEAHLARLVKLYQLVGVKKGMVCLNLCSYELNSGGRLMEAAFKASGCGVIPLGPVSTPEKVMEAASLIKALNPAVVNAYTNQLFDLFALLGGKHSIERCLVNGEPLWPAYRKRIEKMGKVKVHDHYGAMEISGLAVAIKPDDQYMRVINDDLLLEVVNDSGKASSSGIGDLVVTDLNNTSMPFIRYRIGDKVELVCQKGASWIKVISRTEDSLLINGVVVLKNDLIQAANDALGHPGFFFLINKHPLKYYDKLILNVLNGVPRQFSSLKEALVKAGGLDRCIEIRKHQGAIPRTVNGKIKYFIDARKEV